MNLFIPYLLYSTLSSSSSVADATGGDCPDKFERREDNCYIYIPETSNKTYSAASDHCKSMKAFLAEPRTLVEFALVVKFTKSKTSINLVWLGGTMTSKKDTAVWLSDGQPLSYDKWAPDYPKEHEGVYLGLVTNLDKPYLVNVGGDHTEAFLCQIKLDPSRSVQNAESKSSDLQSIGYGSQGSLLIALSVSLSQMSYF